MRKVPVTKHQTKAKRAGGSRESSFLKQLASYASAAGAAACLGGPTPLAAKIVYTPVNVTLLGGQGLPPDRYLLRPDGVHPAVLLSAKSAFGFVYLQALGVNGGEAVANGDLTLPLIEGQKIGASANFNPTGMFLGYIPESGGFGSFGYWLNTTNGYFGFKFTIGGRTHYGWARMTTYLGGGLQVNGMLTGFAYETIPGRRILAGQEVGAYDEPEAEAMPGPLGALALGAAGVPIWRKEEDALAGVLGGL